MTAQHHRRCRDSCLQQTRNEKARAALASQLQRVEQAMRAEQDRRRTEKIEAEWKASAVGALLPELLGAWVPPLS